MPQVRRFDAFQEWELTENVFCRINIENLNGCEIENQPYDRTLCILKIKKLDTNSLIHPRYHDIIRTVSNLGVH